MQPNCSRFAGWLLALVSVSTVVIAKDKVTEEFLIFLSETTEIDKDFPDQEDMVQLLELPMLDRESAGIIPVKSDDSESGSSRETEAVLESIEDQQSSLLNQQIFQGQNRLSTNQLISISHAKQEAHYEIV